MNRFKVCIKAYFQNFSNKSLKDLLIRKFQIPDQCADTKINQNIHDTNASFEIFKSSDHTLIPIEYRQQKYQEYGFLLIS